MKKYIKIKELQERLSISERLSYSIAHESGALVRLPGGGLRIDEELFDEYMSQNRVIKDNG